ncbi:MAG: methyl-accepting chemotaxis protein [Thermoflexaceae bacterium]|nr:methyl-accepting chemotaxis protein [Thermoflexaceae bacterium]
MKITIKKKMLFGAVCPLVLLGAVVILITTTIVTSSMKDEIQNSLRATAISTLAAYEQNAGDYFEASNGDIWKGGYNISKSETLVDAIKENAGMDVTFFYGTRRVITSAVDETGARILGSPAGSVITEKVLKEGNEYFSEAVSIDGVLNYGYYIPVYQKGDSQTPIGMIFVGADKVQKDAIIRNIIGIIVVSVLIVMFIGIIVVLFISSNISNSIKKNVVILQNVASGDLNVWVEDKYLKQHDEAGDLARAVVSLKDSLKNMVKNISVNADELIHASGELDFTAQNTIDTLHNVESSVNVITESASRQAQDTITASDNVNVMGELISDTIRQVEKLNTNADVMRKTSSKASETIRELMEINEQVKQSIETITEQTSQTNKSVQKIKDATNIITSIAEETTLLSLNASIEAARAGEAGRGFAVVADQIQKLAIQSNEASGSIDNIINTLIDDSNSAVDAMAQVKSIVEEQNESMVVTKDTVGEVMTGIEESLESIEVIADKTMELENARNNIITIVKGLSEAAEQNAASTEETCAATTEVSGSFDMVGEAAGKLKNVANTLADSLGNFRI